MPTQKTFYLSNHEQRVNGIPHTRPGAAATDPLHLKLGAGKAEQRLRDCEYRQTEYTPPRLAPTPSMNARRWSGVGIFHRILTDALKKNGAPR